MEAVAPSQTAVVSDGLALIASFMLASAGLAHFSVTPHHLEEWWLLGVLMAAAAGSQLWLAVALILRPSRRLLGVAVAVSAALACAWAVSRTAGLPFGPQRGVPEQAELLDVVTTLEEGLLIVLLGVVLADPSHRRSRRVVVACEAAGITLGVVLTLAFAGGGAHG